MKIIEQEYYTGERSLFAAHDLEIINTTFGEGESPLKESRNINLNHCEFKWKYPLWYSKDIVLNDCVWFEMARSGVWYTKNIEINNCAIEAPKNFRRCSNITMNHVTLPNADETFWDCDNLTLNNVDAQGDYFGMNTKNIKIDGFNLDGNYAFDGASNIEIHHAKMLSKDAFWNCENVTVYDSAIYGEYLGWNSKNVKFVNCTIDSLQGMCYMENVILENCRVLNTNLAFEYSSVKAEVTTKIDSIKNPLSGVIKAKAIDEQIFDDDNINRQLTAIITDN